MLVSLQWVALVMDWLTDPATSDQNLKRKQEFALRTPKTHPSSLTTVGKSNPLLNKKAAELARELKNTQFEEIVDGATSLWIKNILEARIFACKLLGKFKKQLNHAAWKRIDEEWIDLIDHWTSADHLCLDVLSYYPLTDETRSYIDDLQSWSLSLNPWRRRVSLAAFVRIVRKNASASIKMENILNNLIADEDYYVRKAITWILRETTKSNPEFVKKFVTTHEEYFKKTEIKEILRKISSSK